MMLLACFGARVSGTTVTTVRVWNMGFWTITTCPASVPQVANRRKCRRSEISLFEASIRNSLLQCHAWTHQHCRSWMTAGKQRHTQCLFLKSVGAVDVAIKWQDCRTTTCYCLNSYQRETRPRYFFAAVEGRKTLSPASVEPRYRFWLEFLNLRMGDYILFGFSGVL